MPDVKKYTNKGKQNKVVHIVVGFLGGIIGGLFGGGSAASYRVRYVGKATMIQESCGGSVAGDRDIQAELKIKGGEMKQGGALVSSSSKQQTNTRSSTESELIVVGDMVANSLWCLWFLKMKGFAVGENTFQDNQLAMKLKTKGKQAAGNHSRHIYFHYYFTKDLVDLREVTI